MKNVPFVDMTKCTRCNICVNDCPESAISIVSNSCCAKCIKYCISFDVPCHPEYLDFDYTLCDSCGICLKNCPHDAIYWTDEKTARLKKMEQQ